MKKPHVIINCAMSADGKIAQPDRKQMSLSCDEDRARMYKLRHNSDAVLVGIGTILTDDPKLTVKETYIKNPKQPLRIILDTHGKIPVHALAVNDAAPTLLITNGTSDKAFGDNVEIIPCETDDDGLIDLSQLLELLYYRGVNKLMVEGGSTVIWSFLRQKLVDDLYVYIAPLIIGGKQTPTLADGNGIHDVAEVISLEIANISRLGPGLLVHYRSIP